MSAMLCGECGMPLKAGFDSAKCPRGSACALWPRGYSPEKELAHYQAWEKSMKAALASAAPVMERLEVGSHMLVPCCSSITEDWIMAYMERMGLSNFQNARMSIVAMLASVPQEH
jgi:hypothetical protein